MRKLKARHSLSHDKKIFDQIDFSKFQFSPRDDRDYTEEIACADIYEEVLPDEYIAPKTKVLNQNAIGSCVSHAIATALAQAYQKIHNVVLEFSRGFIYGNREEDQYQGEGMRTREALHQVNHYGDCLYEDFPYNETYPNVKKRIEADKENLFAKALPYKIENYYHCANINEIKRAVYRTGEVVIAIRVYEDFSRDLHKSKSIVARGGHAMCIVGWTKDNRWIVQNSWGTVWGYSGFLYMDFDYPLQEAFAININQTLPQPTPTPTPTPKPHWLEGVVEALKQIILAIINIFKKK